MAGDNNSLWVTIHSTIAIVSSKSMFNVEGTASLNPTFLVNWLGLKKDLMMSGSGHLLIGICQSLTKIENLTDC